MSVNTKALKLNKVSNSSQCEFVKKSNLINEQRPYLILSV